jgi:RNA polymerase sigma-70 factor (ECF subfamily)
VSTVCVSDAELVARARDGDHAAFGDLVDRHRTAVYRAAMAALGSHAEADDAAQEAFVLAWRRLNSFRAESSFKTWLLTIAWHQAINRRRGLTKWWKRMMSLDAPDTARDPISSAPLVASASDVVSGFSRTPEQLASSDELRRDIRTAIRALSPKLRDALMLAQSGDYSYEEIGTMVRAPVGTIKWRVAEARRRVKQRLHKLGHDELG